MARLSRLLGLNGEVGGPRPVHDADVARGRVEILEARRECHLVLPGHQGVQRLPLLPDLALQVRELDPVALQRLGHLLLPRQEGVEVQDLPDGAPVVRLRGERHLPGDLAGLDVEALARLFELRLQRLHLRPVVLEPSGLLRVLRLVRRVLFLETRDQVGVEHVGERLGRRSEAGPVRRLLLRQRPLRLGPPLRDVPQRFQRDVVGVVDRDDSLGLAVPLEALLVPLDLFLERDDLGDEELGGLVRRGVLRCDVELDERVHHAVGHQGGERRIGGDPRHGDEPRVADRRNFETGPQSRRRRVDRIALLGPAGRGEQRAEPREQPRARLPGSEPRMVDESRSARRPGGSPRRSRGSCTGSGRSRCRRTRRNPPRPVP